MCQAFIARLKICIYQFVHSSSVNYKSKYYTIERKNLTENGYAKGDSHVHANGTLRATAIYQIKFEIMIIAFCITASCNELVSVAP